MHSQLYINSYVPVNVQLRVHKVHICTSLELMYITVASALWEFLGEGNGQEGDVASHCASVT